MLRRSAEYTVVMRRYLPKSTEQLIHWYERYVSPLSLVAGFVADNFILLRRVDVLQSNLLLLSYLLVAASGIVCINAIETGRVKRPIFLSIAPFVPVVVQFAFGGLFSGFLSLYSRSASSAITWIFVIGMAALLIGNERFRRRYLRYSFQIGMYFTALFAYLIFFLPVVFKKIGPVMFLISGIASIALIALFLYVLHVFVPELEREKRTQVSRVIGGIFLLFNLLYFTNAIPPLPLSLKQADVYHRIERTADGYEVLFEPRHWYTSLLARGSVFHTNGREPVYVWSSVFAPTGLSTTIVHEWQQYDSQANEWVTTNTIPFRIMGGREGGFRGYTSKSGIEPGRWRVVVKTSYGAIIGRVLFTVEESTEPPELESDIL